MAVKSVVPVILGVNSRDGPLSTATPSYYHLVQSIGQQPSHIQYERGAVLSGKGRQLCSVFHAEGLCSAVAELLPHQTRDPHPTVTGTEPAPVSPPRISTSLPSPTNTPGTPDPVSPSQPSITPVATTTPSGQNPSPNSHPSPYSSSQSTTTEASTGSGPPSGNESSATSSNGSNQGGVNPSESSASNSISTVTSPSGAASSTESSPPQNLPPYIMHPSPSGSPLPFPSPSLQTPRTPPRRLSTGAIIGIAVGALAAIVCTALALFLLFRRRARRRSKRMSIESSRRRLEPHSYDDGPSRPVSSVWTWFGSVSVDPDFEPQSEPSAHSLDFQFAEKPHASVQRSETYAPSPSPSPCPSPSPSVAETQPLARGMSPLPLAPSHEDLHLSRLRVPSPASGALSSPDLLALARTDYAGVVNPLTHGGAIRRSVSGVSHTTATSGDVQSGEAL